MWVRNVKIGGVSISSRRHRHPVDTIICNIIESIHPKMLVLYSLLVAFLAGVCFQPERNVQAFVVQHNCAKTATLQGATSALLHFRSTSRLFAKKYDPADQVVVKVCKPLGIDLAEVEEGGSRGVYVDDLDAAGNLAKVGKVKKGYFLMKINQDNVASLDFDSILDKLGAVSDKAEMTLTFIDYNRVIKGPATLTVESPDQPTKQIQALKGLNLRRVLLDNKVEVYDLRGKMSNCGGGGSCTTCVVRLVDNEDWDATSDYEVKRTKKYGSNARLSCMTTIEGDCTVRVRPAPTSP